MNTEDIKLGQDILTILVEDEAPGLGNRIITDELKKLGWELPTGATIEEIDLSRFGKGTYVIKFTDRLGVCYERVVLE